MAQVSGSSWQAQTAACPKAPPTGGSIAPQHAFWAQFPDPKAEPAQVTERHLADDVIN